MYTLPTRVGYSPEAKPKIINQTEVNNSLINLKTLVTLLIKFNLTPIK